jgi:hypothetical protein
VKATQVTGLAAGREYLRFFFDPVATICLLYQRYGPVTALGKAKFKQPRDLLLFAIGPEFHRTAMKRRRHQLPLLPVLVADHTGEANADATLRRMRQIREMVDFSAAGAG